jgi:hypothetical protein
MQTAVSILVYVASLTLPISFQPETGFPKI